MNTLEFANSLDNCIQAQRSSRCFDACGLAAWQLLGRRSWISFF